MDFVSFRIYRTNQGFEAYHFESYTTRNGFSGARGGYDLLGKTITEAAKTIAKEARRGLPIYLTVKQVTSDLPPTTDGELSMIQQQLKSKRRVLVCDPPRLEEKAT